MSLTAAIQRAVITNAAFDLLRRHGIPAEAALFGDFARAVKEAVSGEPSRGLASHGVQCVCLQCAQAQERAHYVEVVAMPILTLDQWTALPRAIQLAIVALVAPVLQGGDAR